MTQEHREREVSDSNASAAPQRSATLSARIQNQLNLLSASMRRNSALYSALLVLLAGTVAVTLLGLIDYYWPLTTPLRALALLLVAASSLFALIKCLLSIRTTPFDAAVDVEQAHPELGQRLRTAWQYRATNMTGMATPELVDAMIEDTNVRAEQMDFAGVVTRAKLVQVSAAIAILILLGLAVLISVPETRITLARLTLFPIHYSQVNFEPPRKPIIAGSAVSLDAEITGRPVPTAEVWIRQLGSQQPWTQIPMTQGDRDGEADQESSEILGRVFAKLDDNQHDLEYRIVAGPVVKGTYQLKVLQPLEQEAFAAKVEPPDYTGVEPRDIEDLAFTVPEGSKVQLHVTLNRAPESARLIPIDQASRSDNDGFLEMHVDDRQLVCDLGEVNDSQQFEIVAKASDGMSFESDRVRIRVDKDHKPIVRFNRPNEQIEATPTTEVALAVDISDDYGLGRIGIEYQIGNGQKRILWEQNLDGKQTSIRQIPVLYLEKHQLNFDDAITYYAFAEDMRETPRRSSSELQFIDIRPYKREFQIVDSACQGGGGACITLEELIARQRQNLRRTFTNVDTKVVSDSLAQRLAKSQQEIREATHEFTTGWEKQFGPVDELHDAIASMELAESELTEKRLPTGMLHEKHALERLVRARKNLRRFIKNCSGGSLAQCQTYDNQMLQKLRAPEKNEEDQEADPQNPNSVQPQLDQLAKQQREWSEQLKMHASRGVQLDNKKSNTESSTEPSTTINQLAQSQQLSSDSAQQMQEAIRNSSQWSPLSEERMDKIAQRIAQSLQDLEDGNLTDAARRAEQAAELAEDLNEHLRGLGAADLSERLAVAEQIARRVAGGERELSTELDDPLSIDSQKQEAVANIQDHLADQVETLGDLLKHLEADASLDHSEMQRELRDLQEIHRPTALSDDMRSSADKIRAGEFSQARRGTQDSSRELRAMASRIAGIRREFLQPRLDELLAAEAKAAGMLADLKNMDDPATQAKMTTAMRQLEGMLRTLNINVARSAGSNAGRPQSGTTTSHSDQRPDGKGQPHFGRPALGEEAQLRQIIQVLQQKIQDAIMLSARMDADEPVPPIYRRLVDEYYQTLSDDLR